MNKKVLKGLVLIALVAAVVLPVQVLAQMAKQQREARIPTVQQLADMINRKKLDNMVLITGGMNGFSMGLSKSDGGDDYSTPHRVTLSNYYIGMYPVTQGEFNSVMGVNYVRSRFMGSRYERQGGHHPAENVTWYDAIEYCNKLSQKEGLTPVYTISSSTYYNNNDRLSVVTWNRNANGYRLPTEAEWEFACRAGTTTRFNTGNNITEKQAAFDAINGGVYSKTTHSSTVPVGSYRSNPWGLYDMHGNVFEWCWDWYGSYQINSIQNNPIGNDRGEKTRYMNNDPALRSSQGRVEDMRIIRGGCWDSNSLELRSGYRSAALPNTKFNLPESDFNGLIGFRIARNAP